MTKIDTKRYKQLQEVLTKDQQKVLVLTSINGLGQHEIAKKMKCCQKTVSNLLESARIALEEAGLPSPMPKPVTDPRGHRNSDEHCHRYNNFQMDRFIKDKTTGITKGIKPAKEHMGESYE